MGSGGAVKLFLCVLVIFLVGVHGGDVVFDGVYVTFDLGE